MNGFPTCGFAANTVGLASVESYWAMPKMRYAIVGMTQSVFGWSSQILGLSTFINTTAGESSANFLMRSSVI